MTVQQRKASTHTKEYAIWADCCLSHGARSQIIYYARVSTAHPAAIDYNRAAKSPIYPLQGLERPPETNDTTMQQQPELTPRATTIAGDHAKRYYSKRDTQGTGKPRLTDLQNSPHRSPDAARSMEISQYHAYRFNLPAESDSIHRQNGHLSIA
jgi:hypothetical protein